MGNQLTAIAPTQILPLENYFSELTDYSKPISLGSTRFMKVARSKYSDGTEVVVKVFVKHDSTSSLGHHEKRLQEIRIRLHGNPNALPFQAFWKLDRAAYLVRQHIQYNLYDRLSTRPFLNVIEKKWLIFQLLKCLEDAHNKKICHGDIKCENILLTSWDWVLLTDFASFKPTQLPADNPADFAFFFDTSRRRTCYIAPERFVHSADFGNYSHTTPKGDTTIQRNKHFSPLTPEMDIFSLGCVIAELFLDGQRLFDLSHLLEYCVKAYQPDSVLKKLSDKHIRRMVRNMINLDSQKRMKAVNYLSQYKGVIFPEYFYHFLYDYFVSFTSGNQLTPDQRIKKLYGDIEAILANIFLDNTEQDRETGYGDVLVIVLSAITSNLRVTQFATSRLQALEMMKTISQYLRDECILERIVPYLHYLVQDTANYQVRSSALRTLSYCLKQVRKIPKSDFNLFQEYLIPVLRAVRNDVDVQVRVALAECIADLALAALRFLEHAHLQVNQEAVDESTPTHYQIHGSYDSQLAQLHEMFDSIIVHLLSDNNSNVKKSFLNHSAGKLCIFFGAQKAKEIILSHMITYLNDKNNWELHLAFFDAIVDVATQIGHRSLDIVEALLQQGLSDSEEWVIFQAISAMTKLCDNNVFNHHFMISSLHKIIPFLGHSNIWIRYSAVGFVLATYNQLDEIDSLCYIVPLVRPFLKHPITSFKNQLVLLNALKEPIPRAVMDYILKQPSIENLFECLTEIKVFKKLSQTDDQSDAYNSIHPIQQQLFRKLIMLGLKDENEEQLLILKDHLLKQHSNRQQGNDEAPPTQFKGVVDLRDLSGARGQSISLEYKSLFQSSQSSKSRRSRQNAVQQSDEWSLMFGEDLSLSKSEAAKRKMSKDLSNSTDQMNKLVVDLNIENGKEVGHRRVKSDGGNESPVLFDQQRSLVRVEQTTCMENLQLLLNHKRSLYVSDMRSMDEGYLQFPFYQAPNGWSPKGQLVAHIHDHLQSVNKLKVLPDSPYFASFSDDGMVKLWDVSRIEGLHVINKPKGTYTQGGKIKTGCFCMGNQSIVSGSSDGSIYAFSIEMSEQSKTPKLKNIFNYELNMDTQGSVVEMSEMTSGGQNVLAFVTTKGHLCGLDLRARELAWNLENDPKYGLMLSMAVDPFQCWLALGTSLGYHVIWDMRFRLPIRHWQHEGHGKPYVHRINQLTPHPNQPSSLISAASGNNEVSIWDMETAARRQMIWASPAQPFGAMTDNAQQHCSVRSLYTCVVGNSPILFTGGSDQYIRLWNLKNPSNCACIVRPDGIANKMAIKYNSQVIEGVEVFRELKSVSRSSVGTSIDTTQQSDSHVPQSHVDYITSLAAILHKSHHVTQHFLISSAHDGTIKLWR